MTNPTDNYQTLRRRWLERYSTTQAKSDTRLRTILIEAAQDAYERVIALENSSVFSTNVRAAQLRMTMKELDKVFYELFQETLEIIVNGQQEAARVAVAAFAETDRRLLAAAFRESAEAAGQSVEGFIDGQERTAMLGVAHTISRITKSEQPLSTRVYRTRSLANQWVSRQVNVAIMRNASAKEIAKTVRTSIRPDTPGGVSYAAMRLGRTEINNAFHATSIDLAQDRPWVQEMDWHLSKTHDPKTECLCEVYAKQTFPVTKVPPKPHPQCRCFVTPRVEPYDVFLTRLTAGEYRDWISNAA